MSIIAQLQNQRVSNTSCSPGVQQTPFSRCDAVQLPLTQWQSTSLQLVMYTINGAVLAAARYAPTVGQRAVLQAQSILVLHQSAQVA